MGKNSITIKLITAGAGNNLAIQLEIFFQFAVCLKFLTANSFQLLNIKFILRSVWTILGNKEMNIFGFVFYLSYIWKEALKVPLWLLLCNEYLYYFKNNLLRNHNFCFSTQSPVVALCVVYDTWNSVFKK